MKKISILLLLASCLLASCDNGYNPLKGKSYFDFTSSSFLGDTVSLEEDVTSITYIEDNSNDYRVKAIKGDSTEDLIIKGVKGDLNASSLRLCSYKEFDEYVAFSLYPFDYEEDFPDQYSLIDNVRPISVLDDKTREISNYTYLIYKPKMLIRICPCTNSINLFYNVKSEKYEYPVPLMYHYSGYYLIHDYCKRISTGDGLSTFKVVGDGSIKDWSDTYKIYFSGDLKNSFYKAYNVNSLSSHATVCEEEDDKIVDRYNYVFYYYYTEWEGKEYIGFETSEVRKYS